MSSTPSSEDKPSAAKMSRFVFKEALQNPTTIFPASAMLISGVYLSLIDLNRVGLAVLLGCGALSALSFVWHYFFRFDKIVKKLFKGEKEARFKHLEERQQKLYRDCQKAGFQEGATEVRQLSEAYDKLQNFLLHDPQAENRPQAQRFLVIATEAYKEGLSCLQAAMEAHKLRKRTNPHTLRTEMVAWTAERHRLNRQPGKNRVRIQALTTKIETHQMRLLRQQQQSDQVAEYLAQSEVIEAALETTLFDVSKLLNQSSPTMTVGSVDQLEKAVEAARRIEEKLRSMETPDLEADNLYREAGQRNHES